MNKPIYEISTDHQMITVQDKTIVLDNNVIGIQLRVLSTSGELNLTYGLNEAAGKVPLSSSDLPASYGGFHVDGIPCVINGELNIHFVTNTAPLQALVVLTRLVPKPTGEVIEICE